MLALAAAAHGSVQSSETVALIAAIFIAVFWRALIKVGLALLVIMILVLLFGGASAIMSVLHG
jgi:hypothetical protein